MPEKFIKWYFPKKGVSLYDFTKAIPTTQSPNEASGIKSHMSFLLPNSIP